jgi:hypothetical protein
VSLLELAGLLRAVRALAQQGHHVTCAGCRFFENDARFLEREIPGLTSFSSGDAAARDRDGLCRRHERLISAASHCVEHELREG